MDIEKIKNTADMEAQEISEREMYCIDIREKLIDFYKLKETFTDGWADKMKLFVDSLIEEAEHFFQESDFQVVREHKTEEFPNGTELHACYEKAEVVLKDLNYSGEPIQVFCDEDQVAEFYIGTPEDVPKYYLWNQHVDICGTLLYNLGDNPEEVYNHFVQEDTCIDEIYVIHDEVKKDIRYYNSGISALERVKLIIYRTDQSGKYGDFRELWDAI